MKSRIVTLFGEEELVPEELRAVPKAGADARLQGGNELPQKQYYSIGEVANMLNVRTSGTRFWTTEFALKVRTTQKGDRLYTPQNVDELRAIYHLVRERGFTIAGAKAKLSEQSEGSTAAHLDLKASLLRLRNQLSLIRNKLV